MKKKTAQACRYLIVAVFERAWRDWNLDESSQDEIRAFTHSEAFYLFAHFLEMDPNEMRQRFLALCHSDKTLPRRPNDSEIAKEQQLQTMVSVLEKDAG